jgi:hypothetical protein
MRLNNRSIAAYGTTRIFDPAFQAAHRVIST